MTTPSKPDLVALAPCPFCGGEAFVRVLNGGQQIICCEGEECFGPRTTAFTLQDATVQWNTRSAASSAAVRRDDVTFEQLVSYRGIDGKPLRDMILDHYEGQVTEERALALTKEYIESIYQKFWRKVSTTPSTAVREALENLLRCANAIVGADTSDPDAAEAFQMFDDARVEARRALSGLGESSTSSDGGVEGHATPQMTSATPTRYPEMEGEEHMGATARRTEVQDASAKTGPAGIKPGPSEATTCQTCTGDGYIDVGAYRDVKCRDCDGTGVAKPAPAADRERIALEDSALLDWLRDETCDLRCIDVPTGGGDADVRWEVVQHHMAKPHERVIGQSYSEEPRDAIRDAILSAGARR